MLRYKSLYSVQSKVPTVLEAATVIEKKRKETGSNVGLYIETKRPAWHISIGLPLEQKLIDDIAKSGFSGIFFIMPLFTNIYVSYVKVP